MSQTIKFGKIEVPVGDGLSPHMPTNGGKFVEHGDIIKTLAIGIRDNLPVLIIGESGTGKTSAIRYLANETKNGLRRVNLNGGTTADELVGRLLINGAGTYWVDGVLTEAMRKGEWIVLDEINAALPEVLFVLQSVMDDDGYLVLNEKDDKEIVRKHENFRLFATCNPPEYAGTKEMNKALLSRFGICITANFPPEAKELEIIHNHLGDAVAKSDLAIKLVGMAKETRDAKEAGNSEYAINTRDILHTLKLAEFVEPTEALCLAFANKLDPVDQKAIRSIAKLHLPTKKGAKAQRTKIKTAEDLVIGGHFLINEDIKNSYLGLTKNQEEIDDMEKKSLGDIIENFAKESAIKGDEFTVEASFYEENASGVDKTERTDAGLKVASIVKFLAGSNKDKRAVILHHRDLDDTLGIIESIYSIS